MRPRNNLFFVRCDPVDNSRYYCPLCVDSRLDFLEIECSAISWADGAVCEFLDWCRKKNSGYSNGHAMCESNFFCKRCGKKFHISEIYRVKYESS